MLSKLPEPKCVHKTTVIILAGQLLDLELITIQLVDLTQFS